MCSSDLVFQAQHAQHGQPLGGKGFVEFNHIELRQREAGLCQHLLRGRGRPDAHDARRHTGGGHADHTGPGGQAVLSGLGLTGQQQRAQAEAYLRARYFSTPNQPLPQPPSEGMVLWLKADAGVNTQPQSNKVLDWFDLAPGAGRRGSAVGAPLLVNTTFPNGTHPAIRFDGKSGFTLNGAASLNVQDLAIYIVASADASTKGRTLLANHGDSLGWNVGVSDANPGRVKWWTAPADTLEPAGASLGNNAPALITATRTRDALKTSRLDLVVAGTKDAVLMVESEADSL